MLYADVPGRVQHDHGPQALGAPRARARAGRAAVGGAGEPRAGRVRLVRRVRTLAGGGPLGTGGGAAG